MKRAKHSLSHNRLFSCDMGELVPIGLVEVVPGDTMQKSTSALVRFAPMLAPIMSSVDVQVWDYFVPLRLLWENFEDFITGGPDGEDASVFPTITMSWAAGPPETGSGATGGLADYLGVPTTINGLVVSALPFRAYALIFNEMFRDEDLVAEVGLSLADGNDTTTNTSLLNRAWMKDYFTTSRPWPQKGPTVTVPLTGEVPVLGIGKDTGTFSAASANVRESDGTTTTYNIQTQVGESDANFGYKIEGTAASNGFPNIRADLDAGDVGIDVNEFRLAFALQTMEENRARYGSRFTEYLRQLGVRSSDARLQRPEYLGGGRQTIQFAEILQTAPNTEADPEVGVGSLYGHGIGAMRSRRWRRFFEEPGYVVSLMSVQPRTQYVQGLARTWNRRTKTDFFQPELAHIGQMEVLNKELYAAHASPDGTFGWQDRYDDYRRQESWISGQFRTSLLDYWHTARIFTAEPTLNGTFVTSNPTKRIFTVTDSTIDSLWIKAYHSIQARRIVPKRGTPRIV